MSNRVKSEKQELKRRGFFTVERVSSDEQGLRIRTERARGKKGASGQEEERRYAQFA